IPLAFGLVGPDGRDKALDREGLNAPADVLELTEASQVWRFTGIKQRPVLSINRGFSAPIRLQTDHGDADRLFLMGSDPDLFNRWEAGQIYAKAQLVELTRAVVEGRPLWETPDFAAALERCLADPELSPAFQAELLTLPSE